MKVLHILQSLGLEGSPRLALGLVEQAAHRSQPALVLPIDPEPDELRDGFEELGAQVLPAVGWTGRDYLSMVGRMRRVFKEHPIEGVICYTVGAHLPIAAAARRLRIPVLLHVGNAPPTDPRATAKIRWQLRLGRRFVTMHVACSEHVRDRMLVDYDMPPGSVTAIANGIDLPRFLSVRNLPAPEDSPLRFGMVGSFEMHKDQPTLIRALAVLQERGIDARLELVGQGVREPEYRQLADRLQVGERIEWTGPVGDVRAALRRLHVFAYSVSDQEGLGIALVEALAAGIPCVGTATGACREVLDNGALGALLPSGDAEAWADAIVAARGSEPAPDDKLARFDIASCARAYERLLAAR